MSVFKKERRVTRSFTIREALALKLDDIFERFNTSRSKVVEHCLEHRDSLDKVYDGLSKTKEHMDKKLKKGDGNEEV